MFLIGIEVRRAPPHSPPSLALNHHEVGGRQVSASITLRAVCIDHVIPKEASLWMLFSLLLALAVWQPGPQTRSAVVIDGWVQMVWLIVPLRAFRKTQAIQSLKTSGTIVKVSEPINTEDCNCETTCNLTKFLVPSVYMLLQSAFWLSFNNECHYYFSGQI